MWSGIVFRTVCDKLPALENGFNIFRRGIHPNRVPVTDPEPFRPKIKPNQINTFVFVRRHPPRLNKKAGPPKRLKSRNYVYDEVSSPFLQRFPDVEVILLDHVSGVGMPGERVKIRGDKAYNNFILPRRAVYASPANIEKYGKEGFEQKFTSMTAARTAEVLTRKMMTVDMNSVNPWTIEKWHIKTAFRKFGIIVPEECIELPEKPISGPDPQLQGKHFIVTVTINKKDKVPVRFRLNHWIDEDGEKQAWQLYWWLKPIDPLFPEDAPKFDSFPKYNLDHLSPEEREELGLPL